MNEEKRKIISDYMSFLGSKGGRVTGTTKARSSEQARKAVMIRWERYRKAQEANKGNGSAKATGA
jgi:hypothetical protein